MAIAHFVDVPVVYVLASRVPCTDAVEPCWTGSHSGGARTPRSKCRRACLVHVLQRRGCRWLCFRE